MNSCSNSYYAVGLMSNIYLMQCIMCILVYSNTSEIVQVQNNYSMMIVLIVPY